MFSNFFSKPSSSSASSLKGYKVSLNKDRAKKYGIAASNLEILKSKIASKFYIKHFNLFLSDGLLIEDADYFLSLPAQTLIIVAEIGEEVKTGELFSSLTNNN